MVQYASYNEKLRDISVDLGRGKGLAWEKEEYGDDTDQSVSLSQLHRWGDS